ncbi:MAG: hypothetical protein LIO46_01070 [Clostridiales bacterium]|nr:hypothetical protein [Clostridiales bacterium]
MKKTLSILMAVAMLAAFSVGTFAAGTITAPEYKTIYGDPSAETVPDTDIPVWGYVGPDALVEPDPDPDVDPKVTMIAVKVPVQILWAAFESDGGTITSSDYSITNDSTEADLKVTVADFDAGLLNPTANAIVDDDLELYFTAVGTGFDAGSRQLWDETNGSTLTANTTAETNTLDAGDTWKFTLSGAWNGDFTSLSDYQQPNYTLTLKFAVV